MIHFSNDLLLHPTPPEQGKSDGQREANRSGEFLHSRDRAHAWRPEPSPRGGGGGQEQNQPGHLAAGGAGEAEERAERHTAGEEDHRGLGANLQGRNGESKMGIQSHILTFTCSYHGPLFLHRVQE